MHMKWTPCCSKYSSLYGYGSKNVLAIISYNSFFWKLKIMLFAMGPVSVQNIKECWPHGFSNTTSI